MKKLKIASFVLAIFASVTIQAQPPAWGEFSGQGSNVSNAVDNITFFVATANAYVPAPVVAGQKQGPGPAILDYLNVTGDKATSKIVFYNSGQPLSSLQPTNSLTGSGSGTTTNFLITQDTTLTNSSQWIPLSESNLLTAGTVVLIRHVATDAYERNRTFSVSLTNIVLDYPMLTMPAAGDIIYPETTNSSILVGVATTAYQSYGAAGGVANGTFGGRPFLMETESNGTNGTINVASGHFPAY